MAKVSSKSGKAYYVGGKRVTVGAVPCRVARKMAARSWYTQSNAFTRASAEQVARTEREWCEDQLLEFSIVYSGCPVSAWLEAYPEIRRQRGDVIPVFEDNSMDVDMFTGEVTVPAGFEDEAVVEAAPAVAETPAAVEIAETPVETPLAEQVVETPRQDADGLWIVRMGERPTRHAPPANLVAEIEWGTGGQIGEAVFVDFSADPWLQEPMTADELPRYWERHSLRVTGRVDADFCAAMHEMWGVRGAEELAAVCRGAERTGDGEEWRMAAGYLAVLARVGRRMAA